MVGNLNIESLQNTATYNSKQKNAGFNLDIDLNTGKNSSLSINGSKTDIDGNHKAVTEQSGIFTQDGGFDIEVSGKTSLTGGAISTSQQAIANNLNQFSSKGGISTTDITNSSEYQGNAISTGINLSKDSGLTSNGIGYGEDDDSQTSVTKAGISAIAGHKDISTDSQAEYAGVIDNVFNEQAVNTELNAQTSITQAFDVERRKIKTELNTKEKALRDKANQATSKQEREDYLAQANKVQQKALLLDSISGAIYGPNSNGTTGYVAKAVSPYVAYEIGQYFKGNTADNKKYGTDKIEVGSAQHLLAHTILGAATSYATGNDALTGSVSASTGEGTAILLSKYIYKTDDPSKLTAQQKDTISTITALTGVAIGATTSNATDTVNAVETSKVAVEDNHNPDRNKTTAELVEETRKMNAAINPYKEYILVGTSFIPIVGNIQDFATAETTTDYILATIGVAGPVGKGVNKAWDAYKARPNANTLKALKANLQNAVSQLPSLRPDLAVSQVRGSQLLSKIDNGEDLTYVGVKQGETGNYGGLSSRSVKDGLTPDHIPSFASVKKALRDSGINLSDSQLRALRNNTNCVVVKTCDHQSFSRTYGGRNSTAKVDIDSKDLYKAAELDLDTWEPVWRSQGWSSSKISATRAEVHRLNKETFKKLGISYGY